MNSVMETLINFVNVKKKAFIHMNTWIDRKDLIKHHCLKKKIFTVI